MYRKLIRSRWVKRAGAAMALCAAVGVGAIVGSEWWVVAAARGRVHAAATDVSACDVALVLGTNPLVDSVRRNLFFEYRMDAAAELFAGGKVRHLIVSGDNHTDEYDEPTAMREALVKRGVPESAITLDYAGFRTLDSVVRVRTVFGQERVVVVSQAFHCERAVFIARRHGIEAQGYVARMPGGAPGRMVRAREMLARTRAVLDVCVLNARPKFDGPAEPIVLVRRSEE